MAKKEEKELGYRLSYKFRIYPTAEQIKALNHNIGCCRVVFNHFLHERKEAYERTQETLKRKKISPNSPADAEKPIYLRDKNGKIVMEEYVNENYDPNAKSMSFFDTTKALTQFKKEVVNEETGEQWLQGADATALIYALKNLDNAYQNFFRGCKKGENIGYPRFKTKKNEVQSYTTQSACLVYANKEDKLIKESDFRDLSVPKKAWKYIYLPKVGNVKIKVHRKPTGKVVSTTISKSNAGEWFASINVKEAELDVPYSASTDNEIGITFGVSHWITTSDGEMIDLPDRMKKLKKKYVREQRRLARKVPGSANFQKQKVKAAKISGRVSNIRRDATNRFTADTVANYSLIAARQMQTKEMAQHKGKATKGLPKKVQSDINQKMSDGNFFEINRQLAYKAQWANRAFALVPSDTPTAQVCNSCGHKQVEVAENLKAEWTCNNCGAVHSRKYNGAVNVLEAGKDILAQEEEAYVTKVKKATEKKKQA